MGNRNSLHSTGGQAVALNLEDDRTFPNHIFFRPGKLTCAATADWWQRTNPAGGVKSAFNPLLAHRQIEVQDSSASIDSLPQVEWTKESRLDTTFND